MFHTVSISHSFIEGRQSVRYDAQGVLSDISNDLIKRRQPNSRLKRSNGNKAEEITALTSATTEITNLKDELEQNDQVS